MEQGSGVRSASTDDARYRLLVDAVTDHAIFMLDPAGLVTSWNPGAARMKGYGADEIIGQHFSRFYALADQLSGLPSRILATAAVEGRAECEGWRLRKDGSRFRAHVVVSPVRDPAGILIGFAKVTRDLGEQDRAEETLRRSEQQFELLVQGVSDHAIYMLDLDGRITNWNIGAQRIKGYQPSEIIGQHFSVFYTPEDRDAGEPEAGLATAARDGRFEKEGWRVRKDGDRFWANVVIDAIRREDGVLVGFAKITRDITEKMEARKTLERTRESLAQSQKMEALGQLTGGVAHDFNNLLSVVIGNLDILGRKMARGDVDLGVLIDNALEGAHRAAMLTQSLLAFSRRQALTLAPLDINRIVHDMSDLIQRTFIGRMTLRTILVGDLWLVQSDENQLQNALVNLAVNARDAMANGGTVTIETANIRGDATTTPGMLPGEYAALFVTDSGTGMTKEVMARAFDPFFTTKPVGQGTGLGLSRVYGFVKQSHGFITLESESGRGTTVKIFFPRWTAATDGAPAPVLSRGRSDLLPTGDPSEIVLVVDDEDRVREMTVACLRQLNYSVLHARNSDEAMTLLGRHPTIALLFTDVVMPDRSGPQLAIGARHVRPDLKVLFTTGYPGDALADGSVLDGGVEFLRKPFTVIQLAEKVRATIDGA